jgi:hypothetical protein
MVNAMVIIYGNLGMDNPAIQAGTGKKKHKRVPLLVAPMVEMEDGITKRYWGLIST